MAGMFSLTLSRSTIQKPPDVFTQSEGHRKLTFDEVSLSVNHAEILVNIVLYKSAKIIIFSLLKESVGSRGGSLKTNGIVGCY